MISAGQLRAARALLGLDQKTLASMSGVSVPTIQRMEASRGTVRGVIESLTRITEALNRAGVEIIADGMVSPVGGCGVRLKRVAVGGPVATPDASDGAGDGSS